MSFGITFLYHAMQSNMFVAQMQGGLEAIELLKEILTNQCSQMLSVSLLRAPRVLTFKRVTDLRCLLCSLRQHPRASAAIALSRTSVRGE